MALAAAVPIEWPPLRVYFGITLILSIIGWTGLARGKLISVREEDFVVAAKIAATTEGKIIVRHLAPSFLSYLIVDLTLSIPRMILGETALSFLGLGLRPPVVNWGGLLNQAQNVKAVVLHPSAPHRKRSTGVIVYQSRASYPLDSFPSRVPG